MEAMRLPGTIVTIMGSGTTGTKYLSGKTNTYEWTITLNKNVLYRISVGGIPGSSPERGFTGQQDLPTLPHRENHSGRTNATSTAITLKWAKLKGINGYYIYPVGQP